MLNIIPVHLIIHLFSVINPSLTTFCLVLRESVTSGSTTVERLYPIAVLPSDFRDRAGELVNQMTSDPGQWQLVRRFFLAEAVSNEPRYARGITLM